MSFRTQIHRTSTFSAVYVEADDFPAMIRELFAISSDVAHAVAIGSFGTFYDHYTVTEPVNWGGVIRILNQHASQYTVWINGYKFWLLRQDTIDRNAAEARAEADAKSVLAD